MRWIKYDTDGDETNLYDVNEKVIVKKKLNFWHQKVFEVQYFSLENIFRNKSIIFIILSTLLTGTDSCLESISLGMEQEIN